MLRRRARQFAPYVESALREEREFVLAMGGFALEIPGAVLVTNERIPVPRFNFVQDVRVSRDRMAAFFERALDHYFQRALRPRCNIALPVPLFLQEQLLRLGFVRELEDRTVFLSTPLSRPQRLPADLDVRPAEPEELPDVARFWLGDRESAELTRSLDVITEHPNPQEEGRPFIALHNSELVATAVLYRHASVAGIHGVATRAQSRGQGAATALVQRIRSSDEARRAAAIAIWSESQRLSRHLLGLGFHAAGRFACFVLPADARMEIQKAPIASVPRWRPPRTAQPPAS